MPDDNKVNQPKPAAPPKPAQPSPANAPKPNKNFAEKAVDQFMSLFQTKPKEFQLSKEAKKALEKEPESIFKVKLVEDIPPIPNVSESGIKEARYPVIEPYAYIHVYWDSANHELVYEVEEPKLTKDEQETLGLIEEGLTEMINISFVNIKSQDKVIEFLEKNVRILLDEFGLTPSKETFLKFMYFIYRDFVGMNRIEPLMRDYFIEDIECNGSQTPLYLVHRKYKHMRTNITFPNNDELARFVEKLAQKCGQYISYANPLLDGALPDGSRVNSTYTQDISSRGPTFTIRKFTAEPWTPVKLMEFRTVSPEILAYLWLAIEYGASIMVIGGTGSGKTSFLNAIAFFIPPASRVVTIEDTRELNLKHENWLPSVARAGFGLANITGEKQGEVSLFDLMKESFRQRPDYIIVGEVRGKEAFVLFQGMASVRGDEEILLLNSDHPKRIAIKDLKENISYKAITADPLTGKISILPVRAKIEHAPRKLLYRIKTKTGREVTVTPDHSLFTYDNGMKSILAGSLKKNDTVAIPGKIPCGYADIKAINLIDYLPEIRVFAPSLIREAVSKIGYEKASKVCDICSISDYYSNLKRSKPSSLKAEKFNAIMKEAGILYNPQSVKVKFLKKSGSVSAILDVSDELLRLLGYYVSEGSLNNSGKNSKISLYNADTEVLEDMRSCIISVSGKRAKERFINRGFGKCMELSFSHKVIFEFIKAYCGKKEGKKVPDFIFGLSKERIGQFLTGLYTGDGCLSEHDFGYYTISRKLANDVTQLLLVYGIVGKISSRQRTGRKNIDYEIKFYAREEKEEFKRYVRPIGKDIELKRPGRKIYTKVRGDLYLDKVKSIERIELKNPEPVYDISVPGTQNFIGGFGGIMLHNSGHPSFGTFHAEDVWTMVQRLETPPISLSSSLVEAMDIVCVIVQAKVKGQDVRRVKEIVEVVKIAETEEASVLNAPFVRDPASDKFFFKTESEMFKKIMESSGITEAELVKEFKRRVKLLMAMYKARIFNFGQVQDVIHSYYKTPDAVLKKFRVEG